MTRRSQFTLVPSTLQGRVACGLLILLAAGLAAFLVSTAGDWPGQVAARLEAGAKVRTTDYARTGSWWAAAVNLGLAGLLLLTCRWWSPPAPALETGAAPRSGRGEACPRRVFWLLLAAAVLAGAWVRAPRLGVSLYADEEYTVRHYVLGAYRQDENFEPQFRPARWSDTFFKDREANNHVLASICGRACLEAWQAAGDDREGRFTEVPLRLPAFLAGLGGIAAAALFLRRLGLPVAGILAAFLCAIHPWHARYSAELRGYGFVLLFVPLAAWFLSAALQTGRRRWWAGFAAAEFLLLYSYPGAVYFPAALNAAALAVLAAGALRRSATPAQRARARGLALRLVVANLLAFMAFLQLMGPCLPQIRDFLALERMRGDFPQFWRVNFWSYLSTGMPWVNIDPGNPIHIAGQSESLLTKLMAWALFPACLLAGAVRLVRTSRCGLIAAVAFLACIPLGYAHARLQGNMLLVWYLIYGLPGVLILAAAGATWPGSAAGSPPALRLACGGAFLALFAAASFRQLEVVRTHSKEPLSNVIAAVYKGRDPFSDEGRRILTAGFWSNAPVYDPWMIHAYSPELALRVMRKALAENRPLYYTYGHRHEAMKEWAATISLLEDPNLFEQVNSTFHGLEHANFNHFLYRFVGDARAVEDAARKLGRAR